ncbi:MAG TPA: type II secretion system protein N [Candidatus Bathyarchaeia archaeon]|nr:type II secretion system protein N [Candidatus Bathyarchaeia archaeon]
MLQGLVIRQAFLIIDWVLVALVLAGMAFLAMSFLEKPAEVGIPAPRSFEGAVQSQLAEVQPRAIYDRFVTSGFLGAAGQDAPPAAPPPPVEVAETQLKLKLKGTAATSPKDLFASAIILNEEDSSINTYTIGQQVVDGVKIEEIYPRKVILFNSNSNRREVLRSDEENTGETTAIASSSAPGRTPGPGRRITLKKNELVQEVFMNYADLVGKIKPKMYYDSNGKVAGITASDLESIPLAAKLDVRNGDVLQSVNNEPIDSEAKVMELVNKYRNSNMVRIGILRNGKPVTVTYRLE